MGAGKTLCGLIGKKSREATPGLRILLSVGIADG